MREAVVVWDKLVRVAHWLLVLSVAIAWLSHHGPAAVHDWAGYLALAVVAARVAWGVVGPVNARFASFVRSPAMTLRYARRLAIGQEDHYLGHNPLGGWSIVALLAAVAVVSLSGWIYTTDAFWGVAWVERVHAISSDLLLALIALHVAGVIFTSRRSGENLIAAMIHGRKRLPDGPDRIK